MKKQLQFAALLTLTIALIIACAPIAPTPTNTRSTAITDYASLLNAVRSAGGRIESTGEITQPFFSVKGRVIKLEGNDIQIFQYASVSAAQTEAARVSPSGSAIGTSMASWMGTPHFYRVEQFIVLYVGDDKAILGILENALGASFASGKAAAASPTSMPEKCASQAGKTIQHINLKAGYCLTYPERFKVNATDPLNVFIMGPGIGAGPESVSASLNIALLGRTNGKSLTQVVDQAVSEFKHLPLKRQRGALANLDAEIIEGIPGRVGSRQMFVAYQASVYRFILEPVDAAFPQAQNDVNELWSVATSSFTFTP